MYRFKVNEERKNMCKIEIDKYFWFKLKCNKVYCTNDTILYGKYMIGETLLGMHGSGNIKKYKYSSKEW